MPTNISRRRHHRNNATPTALTSPCARCAVVDGCYAGDESARAAFEANRIRLKVVQQTDKEAKGLIVLPKRWIVERCFGWVNRACRLAKDFEALIESSHAWFLLARRIARDYATPA